MGSFETNNVDDDSSCIIYQNDHFLCSTRINHAAGKELRFPERYPHRRQPTVDSSNINHSNGLRFKCIDRRSDVNGRQESIAGQQQRIINGHCITNAHQNLFKGGSNFTNGQSTFAIGPLNNYHGYANGDEALINGQPNSANNAAKVNGRPPYNNGYRNIISGCQNGLFINKMVVNHDELIKPSKLALNNNINGRVKEIQPAKRCDNLRKHRSAGVDSKNGIDRLVNCQNAINGRLVTGKELGKDTFGISTDLRQILKPTVVQKRQEIFKIDYDPEDINGPYNFRQLLRPTEYLPTESLRKRKGSLACNGVATSKDKVPEKHVKRRAPLAPNQNKLVNTRK